MSSRPQPTARQGKEIIEEAASFLRQMEISANRGAFTRGRHVAVTVDPRWNDDGETLQILITCYVFGHRQVDWGGLPVFVLPKSQHSAARIAFLNTRGQTVIPTLPPGAYHLSTSSQYGRSSIPVPLPAAVSGLAASPASDGDALIEVPVYESIDGQVRATVRRTQAGRTVVAFETEEETLAGATVYFALVQQAGKVEYSDRVELQPIEGEPRLWEGRWEKVVELQEPCQLVFTVAPKDT